MAKFTTTQTWADGDQVTSTKLNAIISGLSADSDLAGDSTITISSGAIRVGVIGASNIGSGAVGATALASNAVTTVKINNAAVTADKLADSSVTIDKIGSGSVSWVKTLSDDRAVQADMQSETGSHFVSPDVLKFHPGIAKAYGTVAFENGVSTITGGYNVTSAADTGSGREITLGITMANTNYVVMVTGSSGGTPWAVTGKTTTKFTIDGPTEATGRTASFIVFGQRAS